MSSPNTESTIKILKERLEKAIENQDTINDETVVESVKDCLQRLDELDVEYPWLRDSEVVFVIRKLKSHATVGSKAKALYKKWKQVFNKYREEQERLEEQQQQQQDGTLECTGRAAEALQKFRQRLNQLEKAEQKKPDMVAFKELRNTWTPRRRHGEIEGVPIGIKLKGRGEAAILGIHTQIPSGIDSVKDEACYAVCLSGGYVDDNDRQADGSVIYTGSGGKKGKHHVTDQEENVANSSLISSVSTRDPIRLLRRSTGEDGKPEYYYEGLYRCTGYTYEPSVDGPKVYKFKLVPIPGKSTHSVTVRHGSGSSSGAAHVGSRGRLNAQMSRQAKAQADGRGSKVTNLERA